MSAEIVYSLNQIVHSLDEITYKSTQSAHLMNEITLSWIENASQLGKDVRVQVHDESDCQSALVLVI